MTISSELVVSVHKPGAQLSNPGALVSGLFSDLKRSRHIAYEMLKRDLKSQYRTSVLGVLIPLLPALTTAAWAILFRDAHIINVGALNMPYAFFVLFGMLLWASFMESIDAPISGVQSEQALLSKADIPAVSITVARLGQVFVNFGLKSVLLAIAAIGYHVHVSPTIFLAPIGLIAMVMLGASIGLVIAPLNLLYVDIAKVLPVIMTFWFFTTPIIFVSPSKGFAGFIMTKLNPVTPLLTTTRELAFGHGLSMVGRFEITTILVTCLFFVALLFHRIAMPIVIDRANA